VALALHLLLVVLLLSHPLLWLRLPQLLPLLPLLLVVVEVECQPARRFAVLCVSGHVLFRDPIQFPLGPALAWSPGFILCYPLDLLLRLLLRFLFLAIISLLLAPGSGSPFSCLG
jgi:hypothetical protein